MWMTLIQRYINTNNVKTSEQRRYMQSQVTFPRGITLAFHIAPSVQRYLSTICTIACYFQPYPIHRPRNQHWDFLRALPSFSYCTVQHSSTWAHSNSHLPSHCIDGIRTWGQCELQKPPPLPGFHPPSWLLLYPPSRTFWLLSTSPKRLSLEIFNFWSSLRTCEWTEWSERQEYRGSMPEAEDEL